MSKSAIKKWIRFLKMLKAPVQLLPYFVAFVAAVVSRYAEHDGAELVNVSEQGFVCRKSDKTMGGCGSPSVTSCADGSVAAVYACSRVVKNVLVHSICLVRNSNPCAIASGRRAYLYTTPLQTGNVTVTQTPAGLMVSWRSRKSAAFRAPSSFSPTEALSLKRNTVAAINDMAPESKEDGTYYAFVKEGGEPFDKVLKAPVTATQGPVQLSGNELMWMGTVNGKAVTYFSNDSGKTFCYSGTVPPVGEGRTCSEAVCAKLKNGRLFAVMCSAGELFTSFSDDLGKRWSLPKPLHTKGTSPNLCVRDDGALAVCYVVRGKKLSIRCRVSADGQYVWGSEHVVVASTGERCRRPYTTTVDDSFYTVSRQRFCGEEESSVIYTLWKPAESDVNKELKK